MGTGCSAERRARTPSDLKGKKGVTGKGQQNGVAYGVRERFAIPEGAFNAKLPGEKFCTINSSVFLPTGDIILSDSVNKKLKLFNCNFEIVTVMEFPSHAYQVCASPNMPLVYAAFPDRIRQIYVDGVTLRRSGFIHTPGYCRGVCINKYDGKAIAMSINDEVGQVNLLTPGGNLQLEINEDEDENAIFVRPEQMTVTNDLVVMVTDKGASATFGISHQGEIIFKYTGVRYPQAVVTDELNYIYVAGPFNIHQLNRNGELVKLFITKAEIGFSPLSMSYNPKTKVLLITGKGSKVMLFKMT